MSASKTQSPGQGSDAKATEAQKLKAQIFGLVCKFWGQQQIVDKVKEKYPNFGRANGRGFEHNSYGLEIGLTLLQEENPELANHIRRVLGIKEVAFKKRLMDNSDLTKILNAAGVPTHAVNMVSTDQFRVHVPHRFYSLMAKLDTPDRAVKFLNAINGDDVWLVTFLKHPAKSETPILLRRQMPAPIVEPPAPLSGENTEDPIIEPPQKTSDPAKTNPLRTVKFLTRPTAIAVREDQKVVWKDTGLKTFAVKKHGSWYAGRSTDGDLITFHEGNAKAAGQWLAERGVS